MIEVLFTLSITLIIVSNVMPIYRLITFDNHNNYNEDIYIAAKQISEYLIGSKFIDLNGDYYYESVDHKEFCLCFDGRRIVKKEGYEMILSNIDDAYFELDNQYVYLNVQRNDKDYQFLVHIIQQYDE